MSMFMAVLVAQIVMMVMTVSVRVSADLHFIPAQSAAAIFTHKIVSGGSGRESAWFFESQLEPTRAGRHNSTVSLIFPQINSKCPPVWRWKPSLK